MESLNAIGAGANMESEEHSEANRSLPDGIREALQRLLDEYARMEEQRQQASLNEARLHARIAHLEKQLRVDEKARALLAKRVAMLEYALKEQRSRDVEDGAAIVNFSGASAEISGAVPAGSSNLQRPGDHLPAEDDGRKGGFASADNKYKTLPSNFLASSRNAKVMSPGRRMLWKYLEELGYMADHGSQDSAVPARTPIQNASATKIHVQTSLVDSAPSVSPAPSTDAKRATHEVAPQRPTPVELTSSPHSVLPMKEDKITVQKKMERTDKIGRDSVKLRTKSSAGAGSYSFVWTASEEDAVGTDITWKPAMTLMHHLDAVRSVCFHDEELVMFSGAEDGTVKMWNVSPDRRNRRGQPVQTFHSHREMVTSVAIHSSTGLGASCSVDGVVCLWNLADSNADLYDEVGEASKYCRSQFSQHTDAVWDVHFSATSPILFSSGADGNVHLWKTADNASNSPMRTLVHAQDDIPVSCRTMGSDASKVLVAYISGDVVQFDVETGAEIRSMASPDKPRLTCIRAHPRFPLAFAAGVDKSISFYDLNAGSCIHRMLAHAQAVTSLAVSPDGSAMMSACHDSSIRFWDVAKRVCVQDISAHQTHRRKYSEGIHSVVYHASLPFTASGGADCAIKVYQS